MPSFDLIIIISMLVFSALFSGLEIAFVTSDKMVIEMNRKKSGKLVYKILSVFSNRPSRFLATLLIGNNLSLVIYGIYMEAILKAEISEVLSNSLLILLVQTVISTAFILIFAEYLPKALFRLKPYKTLGTFAIPLYGLYWLMKGVVYIFVGISKFLLSTFFRINFEESPQLFGRIELEQYIQNRTMDAGNEDMDTEVQIYKNVLDFSNVKVRECMIPRPEIVALEVDTDIEVLTQTFIDTGLSKILIFRKSIDDMIGFVHHSEMFKEPKRIKNVLKPIGFIPSSMLAQDVLNNFIKQQRSILVVVDEFGGTAGMVTVEDVMEEIFGEIEDEHDVQDHTEIKHSDNEYVFSARHEIDYLNEKYGFKIPTNEEYETIAGYLFTRFESIPEEGQSCEIHNLKFVVEEVSETRIEKVRVFIEQDEKSKSKAD